MYLTCRVIYFTKSSRITKVSVSAGESICIYKPVCYFRFEPQHGEWGRPCLKLQAWDKLFSAMRAHANAFINETFSFRTNSLQAYSQVMLRDLVRNRRVTITSSVPILSHVTPTVYFVQFNYSELYMFIKIVCVRARVWQIQQIKWTTR